MTNLSLAGLALASGYLVLAAGCTPPPQNSPAIEPSPVAAAGRSGGEGAAARPLGQLVNRQVIVFPVQRVVRSTGAPWAPADANAFLRALDDEIAFALEGRGLSRGWTTPAATVRIAARNPSLPLDPLALTLPPAPLRAGDELREPLASQLRSLSAFSDARWAILPIELSIAAGDGMPRAILRLVLVDVRMAQVLWAGETAPAAASSASDPAPSLAARLAEHFTDLIAQPPNSSPQF